MGSFSEFFKENLEILLVKTIYKIYVKIDLNEWV